MTETSRQLAGRGRWRWTSGFLGTFADLLPSPVLVKASLGVQLDPSCAHSGSAEAATNWIAL